MKAEVVQVRGITFVGKASSDHWVSMDGPTDFQGSDSATRPKELILIGLGGCTGADVASILHKMGEDITRFEINLPQLPTVCLMILGYPISSKVSSAASFENATVA